MGPFSVPTSSAADVMALDAQQVYEIINPPGSTQGRMQHPNFTIVSDMFDLFRRFTFTSEDDPPGIFHLNPDVRFFMNRGGQLVSIWACVREWLIDPRRLLDLLAKAPPPPGPTPAGESVITMGNIYFGFFQGLHGKVPNFLLLMDEVRETGVCLDTDDVVAMLSDTTKIDDRNAWLGSMVYRPLVDINVGGRPECRRSKVRNRSIEAETVG